MKSQITVKLEELTPLQARQWLIVNDSEAKLFWLKLSLKGADLIREVSDNLYGLSCPDGHKVQDGQIYIV